MKLEKEISEVTEDGSEIYRSSLLEYYMSRPRQKSNIQNIVLQDLLLITFKPYKNENDYQPDYHGGDTTIHWTILIKK